MGLCWYCYWGWPKPVADIYDKAIGMLEKIDKDESVLDYGPGHIVWADENFAHAEWCLEHFEEYKRDYSKEELEIAKMALVQLSKIPLNIRDPEPKEYSESDETHPEDYPPPMGIEFVK